MTFTEAPGALFGLNENMVDTFTCRRLFGVYHPLYVKALHNYVQFSNKFRKDRFGVEAAIAVANVTSQIYGYSCLHTAEALSGKGNRYPVTR